MSEIEQSEHLGISSEDDGAADEVSRSKDSGSGSARAEHGSSSSKDQLAAALRRREADRRRKLDELAERIEKLESSSATDEENANGSGLDHAELSATIERIEEARRAAAKASAERIAEIEERLGRLREGDVERIHELIAEHVSEVISQRGDEDSGEELRDRLNELEEKLAALPERGPDVDLADAVAKAEARLADAEDRTVGRISEVGEAIHSLRSRLAKLEGEVGESADPARVDELEEHLERVDSERRSHAERIGDRIGVIEEHLVSEAELSKQVEASERTVRDLDERVAELERRVADRIEKLERTFEELRSALLED